jgi:hypothetical protein
MIEPGEGDFAGFFMSMERLRKLKENQSLFAPKEVIHEPVTPMAKLAMKQAFADSPDGKKIRYAEVDRIAALAVTCEMSPAEVDEYSKETMLAEAYNAGARLFPTQANANYSVRMYEGLLGPIGVGWGKTLINLMTAHWAYNNGHDHMMLMLPPEVLTQLVGTDIAWARKRVPLGFPIHVLGGKPMVYRRALAKSRKKGLYIMPYSLLSQKDGEENLFEIDPTIIMLDEAHRVARETAARAKRIMRFLEEKNPKLTAVSGTITSKSVMDYYPLARAALKQNCPLPLTSSLAREWGAIIDATADDWEERPGEIRSGAGPIEPLVLWARRKFPDHDIPTSRDGFRDAYRLRLTTCPGVVTSGDADIACSLLIHNIPVKKYQERKGWKELKELIDKIELMWLTPNNDEIDCAIHKWKWLYELSAGFYNELVWPEVPDLAKQKTIRENEAEDLLKISQDHHALGQIYHKELRMWLETYSRINLDSPMLVGADMARNGDKNVGTSLYLAWKEWKDADFEGRVERDSRAVRVCDFKIHAATEWAKSLPKDEGAVLWVWNKEIGRWLYDYLLAAGLDALHAPAGANEAITDPANGKKKIVASLTSHGTGKNLQHFQNQCMLQWPRPAKTAEQLLGRLHRNGQQADEIAAVTFNTLEQDDVNFAACLNDALYIHLTTGVRQKMIYASYNPMPVIFPPAVLKRRGMENVRMLNEEQEAFRRERFGV